MCRRAGPFVRAGKGGEGPPGSDLCPSEDSVKSLNGHRLVGQDSSCRKIIQEEEKSEETEAVLKRSNS